MSGSGSQISGIPLFNVIQLLTGRPGDASLLGAHLDLALLECAEFEWLLGLSG